jgi:hypothetical protein
VAAMESWLSFHFPAGLDINVPKLHPNWHLRSSYLVVAYNFNDLVVDYIEGPLSEIKRPLFHHMIIYINDKSYRLRFHMYTSYHNSRVVLAKSPTVDPRTSQG